MDDETLLRDFIAEIVRKCGDEWCLYTRKKDPKRVRDVA